MALRDQAKAKSSSGKSSSKSSGGLRKRAQSTLKPHGPEEIEREAAQKPALADNPMSPPSNPNIPDVPMPRNLYLKSFSTIPALRKDQGAS